MTDEVVPATVERLAKLVGPEGDEILADMNARAREELFPTVGPEVGAWLELLVRVTDAKRVFEFGSGYGYSAYWFARGLPADGEVVLTERDADELELAREYFDRGGYAGQAHFEHGDAIEIVDRYEGPFDVVLIDNEKERYLDAFEAVREKLRPGSIVVADNAVTAGTTVDREEVVALLEGEDHPDASSGSRGVASYLDYVREASDLQTVLLPLGEGLAVTLVE